MPRAGQWRSAWAWRCQQLRVRPSRAVRVGEGVGDGAGVPGVIAGGARTAAGAAGGRWSALAIEGSYRGDAARHPRQWDASSRAHPRLLKPEGCFLDAFHGPWVGGARGTAVRGGARHYRLQVAREGFEKRRSGVNF
jgi:hypothetical protein